MFVGKNLQKTKKKNKNRKQPRIMTDKNGVQNIQNKDNTMTTETVC